ncbi:MAG TPA: hypothetical protein VOB72_08245 [Candidatus Dormibacteraeota bacterium]|nr:hypothetical protein [Candidatus Dormibacteraeota bacterium]
MSAAGFRLPGGEVDADRLRAVERELAAMTAAFAASQKDVSRLDQKWHAALAEGDDLTVRVMTLRKERDKAVTKARELGIAYLATRAELASARQEIEQLKAGSGCDCGHEGLDETWHLRPCPVAEARFARRQATGGAA